MTIVVNLKSIILHFIVNYSIISLFFTPCYNGTRMGPYDINIKHFDECRNAGTREAIFHLKLKKYNRTTTVINANMTLKTAFDDDVSISISLAQLTNGGYKDNFFYKKIERICTTFYSWAPGFVKALYEAANIMKCPIQVGTYLLRNFTTSESVNIIPVFFYNKYRGDVQYFKKNKLIGCVRGYMEIVPKKKGKS